MRPIDPFTPNLQSVGSASEPIVARPAGLRHSLAHLETHTHGLISSRWTFRGLREDYLAEFDTLCREAGIPWVLHIIPSEIQVDAAVRTTTLDRLGLAMDDYDFDLPQRRLREFAERHDIICWDPLPDLRTLHRPEARLYVPNDTHWGTRGNMLAGVLLARFIRTEFLEPADIERSDDEMMNDKGSGESGR